MNGDSTRTRIRCATLRHAEMPKGSRRVPNVYRRVHSRPVTRLSGSACFRFCGTDTPVRRRCSWSCLCFCPCFYVATPALGSPLEQSSTTPPPHPATLQRQDFLLDW